MLKPIPQENPDAIRKNTARKARTFLNAEAGGAEDMCDRILAGDREDRGGTGCTGEAGGPCTPPKPTSEKTYLGKMHQKMQADSKKDRNIIKGVCLRMIKFIQKNGRSSREELGELIYGLQRSVLSLERLKQRDFNKGRKRKKK